MQGKMAMNLELFNGSSSFSGNITPSTKYPYAVFASTALNRSLVAATCVLSALGSLTIILSYVSWKDIRTTSRKILLFLSLSDLLIAITNLLGLFIPSGNNITKPRNALCVAQSFITNSASIMSFMWTLTLAVYLHLAIVKSKQVLGKKLLPWFHLSNWSLGPIINIIALLSKMLGYSADALTGGWCWIYHDPRDETLSAKEKAWHLINAKAIEIVVYSTIFVIYFQLKFKLHKELKIRLQTPMEPEVLKSAKSADRKLVFVPILLFLGRFWGLLRFVMCWVNGIPHQTDISTTNKALLTLQGMGDSIQGFLNCILFCFLNPKVFKHLKEAFLFYVCCHPNRPSRENECEPSQLDDGSLNGDDATTVSCPSLSSERPLLEGDFRVKKYGSQWIED